MRHALLFIVATICVALTVNTVQAGDGRKSELDEIYQRFAGDNQQGINFGWIPRVEEGTEYSTAADAPAGTAARADTDAGTGTAARARRESLRRAYQEVQAERAADSRLTAYAAFTSSMDKERETIILPPNVEENGDGETNFAAIFSMSWCGSCRKMYPVVKQLRKEGYLIYFYVCDKEEYEDMDLDAKFDVKMFPTIVVFDKGKEVKRKTGVTNIDWFRKNLKTRDEQSEEEEPENPYDGI